MNQTLNDIVKEIYDSGYKQGIIDTIMKIKEEAKDVANGKAEYMTMEEVFKE